jgi:hypothetical protein
MTTRTLFGKTFTRNITVIAITTAPSLLLAVYVVFFSIKYDAAAGNPPPGLVSLSILAAAVLFVCYVVVNFIAAEIGITRIVEGQMRGEHVSVRSGLNAAFSGLLKSAVRALIFRLVIIGACVLLPLWGISLSASEHSIIIGIVAGAASLAGIFYAMRYNALWSMALPACVCENLNALDSLEKSRDLVAGSWFSVFGLLYGARTFASYASFLISSPFTGSSLAQIFGMHAQVTNTGSLFSSVVPFIILWFVFLLTDSTLSYALYNELRSEDRTTLQVSRQDSLLRPKW